MRTNLPALLLFICFAAFAQISYVPEERQDKYKIKKPPLRFANPLSVVYQEYDMSPMKEEELKGQIRWTLEWHDVKKCKKLGKLTTPGRLLTSYVKDRTNCELSLHTLMEMTKRKGGNTLYIGVMPEDCSLGKFLSYAMSCPSP